MLNVFSRIRRMSPTNILALAMIVVFIMEIVYIGSGKLFLSSISSLDATKIGATFGGGSPLRWLSSLFVHSSFKHFLGNLFSLLFIGNVFERMFSRKTLMRVFFGTGISSNALSTYVLPNVITLGASGAIFGMIGFVITKFVLERNVMGNSKMFKIVLVFLAYNIIATFFYPDVNIVGHLGGLSVGVLGYFLYTLF